jgi:hypothetical protein
MGYIYIIRFSGTNLVYVDQTTFPYLRRDDHLSRLEKGRETNPGLVSAYRSYGISRLEFIVVAAVWDNLIPSRVNDLRYALNPSLNSQLVLKRSNRPDMSLVNWVRGIAYSEYPHGNRSVESVYDGICFCVYARPGFYFDVKVTQTLLGPKIDRRDPVEIPR